MPSARCRQIVCYHLARYPGIYTTKKGKAGAAAAFHEALAELFIAERACVCAAAHHCGCFVLASRVGCPLPGRLFFGSVAYPRRNHAMVPIAQSNKFFSRIFALFFTLMCPAQSYSNHSTQTNMHKSINQACKHPRKGKMLKAQASSLHPCQHTATYFTSTISSRACCGAATWARGERILHSGSFSS